MGVPQRPLRAPDAHGDGRERGAAARRGLVVSVATPGQGGLGHVNEREHADVGDGPVSLF